MTISNATQLQRPSQGLQYPAQKQDLPIQAQNFGVGDNVLSFIQSMPDREYHNIKELRQAVVDTWPTEYVV